MATIQRLPPKIFLLACAAFLAATLAPFSSASAAEGDVVLGLSPDSGTYKNQFAIQVTLNTGNKGVSAADIVLDWNPQDLSITSAGITAGTGLVLAAASVDEVGRTIRFTVYKATGQEITGAAITLATLTFTPKKDVKSTKIDFVTGGSQAIKTGVYIAGENVLTRTSGGTYVLGSATDAGAGGTSTPSPLTCNIATLAFNIGPGQAKALSATASGGTGTYTYSWAASPNKGTWTGGTTTTPTFTAPAASSVTNGEKITLQLTASSGTSTCTKSVEATITKPVSGGTTTPKTASPSASTSNLDTATGEDILTFLVLLGVGLIGGGFLWVVVP